MQQEYPSDDIEAFKYSGKAVFDIYKVEKLRDDCMAPIFIGDIRVSYIKTGPLSKW